jgi:hypothetical protein
MGKFGRQAFESEVINHGPDTHGCEYSEQGDVMQRYQQHNPDKKESLDCCLNRIKGKGGPRGGSLGAMVTKMAPSIKEW